MITEEGGVSVVGDSHHQMVNELDGICSVLSSGLDHLCCVLDKNYALTVPTSNSESNWVPSTPALQANLEGRGGGRERLTKQWIGIPSTRKIG